MWEKIQVYKNLHGDGFVSSIFYKITMGGKSIIINNSSKLNEIFFFYYPIFTFLATGLGNVKKY